MIPARDEEPKRPRNRTTPVVHAASQLPELVEIANVGQFQDRDCGETEDRMGHGKAGRWFAVSVVLAYAAWFAFVGNVSGQELLLGAACAVFSSALTAFVFKKMGIPLGIRFSDAIQLLWIPWYLIDGAWEIFSVLFRDFAGVKKAQSLFRAVGYEHLSGPQGFVRRALAVAGTSVTPNFIVIGIDTRRELLLFFQIERSGIPRITKHLGAKA